MARTASQVSFKVKADPMAKATVARTKIRATPKKKKQKLPSLAELKRLLSAEGANALEKAEANASELIGRPRL